MRTFLISDDDLTGGRARQVLLRAGLDCPTTGAIPLDLAAVHLAHERPELVVVVLSPDTERALAVLQDLRGRTQARVLAVGPASGAKLVLRALRAGADDYVDEDDLE